MKKMINFVIQSLGLHFYAKSGSRQ